MIKCNSESYIVDSILLMIQKKKDKSSESYKETSQNTTSKNTTSNNH